MSGNDGHPHDGQAFALLSKAVREKKTQTFCPNSLCNNFVGLGLADNWNT